MKLIKLLSEIMEVNRTFLSTKFSQRTNVGIRYPDLYDKIHDTYQPCFVLSTGRCGTKLLTNILNTQPTINACHTPKPELLYHANTAYENFINQKPIDPLIIDSARYEIIKEVYLRHKQYVETNNRITFFAFALYTLFPNAKFIHLVRHPEPFVRSGMSRNWYSGYHPFDEGRIKPVDAGDDKWEKLKLVRKISWLWNETNSFIESFKETRPDSSVLVVKSEDLFNDINAVKMLFEFLDCEPISIRKINRLLQKPINKQKNLVSLDNKDKQLIKENTPLQKLYY